MYDNNENQKIKVLKAGGGTNFILPLSAVIIFVIFLLNTLRFGTITGEEVGILLNKMTGKIEVIPESGKKIYNGITHEFKVLDKTLQTLEMTDIKDRGERKGKDDLKIKTIDGSDVYVDLKIQYRIDPAMADTVIKSSGGNVKSSGS